eukprot:309044_1
MTETKESKLSPNTENSQPIGLLCTTINENCVYVEEFIAIMVKSNKQSHVANNAQRILNIFLHLMHKHDHQFEIIFNRLDFCDIETCDFFKRNYRNKEKQNIILSNFYDEKRILYYQILDKVHCYHQHCFDIGNKLSSEEQKQLSHVDNEFKNESILINTQLQKKQHILSGKKFGLTNRAQPNETNKFNSMYNTGVEFKYGYKDENILNNEKFIPVKAKYNEFKEELLSNNLTPEQYNSETQKAKIHFDSKYRIELYPNVSSWDQILALMIYCNYDSLEYVFSKSYRENSRHNHWRFFHLAKLIKMAVRKGGVKVTDGTILSFYHGIGEQLLFPEIIGPQGKGINIYSPLSTSSSFEVAANFTNQNKGLIVEFNKYSTAKCFNVSWLSDYANESEYLFIQNEAPLQVVNITNMQSATDYKVIIKSLQIIDLVVASTTNCYKEEITEELRDLVVKICNHLLSLQYPFKYDAFQSLDKYAQDMISTHCKEKKEIFIDCENVIFKKHLCLQKLLLKPKYGGINFEDINLLFPNIQRIVINNVNLCKSTLNDILRHLRNMNGHSNNPKYNMIMLPKNNDQLHWITKKYSQEFEEILFDMKTDGIRLLINRRPFNIIARRNLQICFPSDDEISQTDDMPIGNYRSNQYHVLPSKEKPHRSHTVRLSKRKRTKSKSTIMYLRPDEHNLRELKQESKYDDIEQTANTSIPCIQQAKLLMNQNDNQHNSMLAHRIPMPETTNVQQTENNTSVTIDANVPQCKMKQYPIVTSITGKLSSMLIHAGPTLIKLVTHCIAFMMLVICFHILCCINYNEPPPIPPNPPIVKYILLYGKTCSGRSAIIDAWYTQNITDIGFHHINRNSGISTTPHPIVYKKLFKKNCVNGICRDLLIYVIDVPGYNNIDITWTYEVILQAAINKAKEYNMTQLDMILLAESLFAESMQLTTSLSHIMNEFGNTSKASVAVMGTKFDLGIPINPQRMQDVQYRCDQLKLPYFNYEAFQPHHYNNNQFKRFMEVLFSTDIKPITIDQIDQYNNNALKQLSVTQSVLVTQQSYRTEEVPTLYCQKQRILLGKGERKYWLFGPEEDIYGDVCVDNVKNETAIIIYNVTEYVNISINLEPDKFIHKVNIKKEHAEEIKESIKKSLPKTNAQYDTASAFIPRKGSNTDAKFTDKNSKIQAQQQDRDEI